MRVGGMELPVADVAWLEQEGRMCDSTRSDLARSLCERRQLVDLTACAGDRVVVAASFSSAALQVSARDEFIVWSPSARRRNRSLVVVQSRFCLATAVHNLASRAQSLLISWVHSDWNASYGQRPVLLDTYVDDTRVKCTCCRAANWQCVGKISGRGRHDHKHLVEINVKSVWVYPLERKWREALCVEPMRRLDPDTDWAEAEWGAVERGDQRLTQRLVELRPGAFCAAHSQSARSLWQSRRVAAVLTTVPVTTLEQAEEKVRWYALRWLIEVFHRTLKSGCGVENRQAKRKETWEAALAVDAVVAWRIMWLTTLGRETAEVPCSIFFDEEEWKAPHASSTRQRHRPRNQPA